MNYISWNCRGLGNSCTIQILGDLVKSRKPDFIFLSETLVTNKEIATLSVKVGLANFFVVDKVGRAGGLAIL